MKQYGLLGKTLKHSFSQTFFTQLFEEQKIDASYTNFELASEEGIPTLLQEGLSGLNVTIPYKEKVIPYLDELSQEAQQIGAVNCIAFQKGKKIGYNTDAYGFHQSIKPFLTNRHEKALILGTGGAAKAVAYVLKNIGIECIFISRSPKGENEFSYDQINELMVGVCKLIVNCTPVGMFPKENEVIDIPYSALTEEHLVVDLIYNPEKTHFLHQAQLAGAQILNGESMLKQQALRAWQIWSES